jgi:hypothetical protein
LFTSKTAQAKLHLKPLTKGTWKPPYLLELDEAPVFPPLEAFLPLVVNFLADFELFDPPRFNEPPLVVTEELTGAVSESWAGSDIKATEGS